MSQFEIDSSSGLMVPRKREIARQRHCSMGAPQQMLASYGAATVTDPNFSSVVLLCHLDGSNNQTTSVDSSSAAHTLTLTGSLQTAQLKFGTSSMGTTVGNERVEIADSADWNFGAGKFTVEAWVYYAAAPGTSVRGVVEQWGNGGSGNLGWFFGNVSGSLAFYYSTTGSDNPNVGATWTPTLNTWYHLAADRDAGNVIRVYANGVVIASATAAVTLFDAPTVLDIAGCNAFTGIQGYIDEVRITKGVARYAGAFTPPTAAFPNS